VLLIAWDGAVGRALAGSLPEVGQFLKGFSQRSSLTPMGRRGRGCDPEVAVRVWWQAIIRGMRIRVSGVLDLYAAGSAANGSSLSSHLEAEDLPQLFVSGIREVRSPLDS